MSLEIQGVELSTGHIATAVALVDQNGNQEIGATASGNENVPNWVGDYYNSVTINAAAGTTSQTLITGSPGYYVTRLFVQISHAATVSVGGTISLTFTDTGSGQVIGQLLAYIPSSFTAPVVPTIGAAAVPGPGFFYRSKTANSTLTVSSNTTLTGTGTIRVAVNGGITSIDS